MKRLSPWLVLLSLPLAAQEGRHRYAVIPFQLGAGVDKLVPEDLDGDGLRDLVVARREKLEVYLQHSGSRFDFSKSSATLELEGTAVGWDIADLSGAGSAELVTLVDGTEVLGRTFEPRERRFLEPRSVIQNASGVLPRGVYHLRFVRDVDGDGDGDLVIPGAGAFSIYPRTADGTYPSKLRVASAAEISQTLDGEGDLAARVGQSVKLPLFTLRDVNGDGARDLIGETDDLLEVYLAQKSGDFPPSPSYSLDLEAERERLGTFDPDDLDLSNLTAAFSMTVQVVQGDVSGDGAEDLLLRSGRRVYLFLATPEGMRLERPQQVLKASGNVIAAALMDENADGLSDLWLIRIEAVSIADVFLWLVASGSLDFDLFVYRNEKGRFARRPSRVLKITLRFRSLLSMVEEAERIADESREPPIPARRADLTGKGEPRDVVVLRKEWLECYFGKASVEEPAPRRQEMFERILGALGYSQDRDEYSVDLTDLRDLLSTREGRLLAKVEGVRPDLRMRLTDAGDTPGVFVLDLNSDQSDDFLLLFENKPEGLRGAVVLSRK